MPFPDVFLHVFHSDPNCAAIPAERILRWESLDGFLKEVAAGGEGAVVAGTGAGTLENLRGARDDAGLPKWGVVDAAEFTGLTPEAAWGVVEKEAERHRLARENARLRGDLLTLGRKIAHDLRSPLGGVLNTAELLKEILGDHSAEDAALTRPVFESVKTISRLVDVMSLVTRATARGAARETLRMDHPLMMALQRLDRRITAAGAKVECGAAGRVAAGDAALLEEIWYQLLENALTHGGKNIRAGREDGGWWHVEDDGPGVSPEKAERLFQPFHTLHDPGSARGLGLPLVERLVALQGGECAHTVPAGGGARFSFRLGGAADV